MVMVKVGDKIRVTREYEVQFVDSGGKVLTDGPSEGHWVHSFVSDEYEVITPPEPPVGSVWAIPGGEPFIRNEDGMVREWESNVMYLTWNELQKKAKEEGKEGVLLREGWGE